MNKYYTPITEITIHCTKEELKEAFDWLFKNGYRTRFSGPRKVAGESMLFHRDKFKIVAYKKR